MSNDQKGKNQGVEGDGSEIVGHKTFKDGRGGFRHEPLTRTEADALWESVEASKAKRAQQYPTAEDAVNGMWEAWYRLQELGWKDVRYAPRDRRERSVVELGSAGIHKAWCEPRTDRPNEGWWWSHSDHDTWPMSPVLYLPTDEDCAAEQERFAKARAQLDQEARGDG